ncbi:D-inositol-3-phosphate glycosyltransferase [Pseudomonas fluorescens]|uniref:D-inositol-3-phosphate glycosyltransferase n=1 Tax=Pseudomonas fluorescens TaxID=294 RepID=A0A5E7B3M6_PSEFL|nr:D-inositol-3-phosphate glycosyltransferase [Pseudomonas fluorescens]
MTRSSERQVLQFCHGYDGPFLDCARQYASLFAGTGYRVTTVFLTGVADAEVAAGCASDEVVFLEYSSKAIRGLKLEAIRELREIAASRNFSLCIAHRFKPIYIALLATDLPVIGVHHAFGDYQRRSRKLFAHLLRKRLSLLGVSDAVRDDMRRCLPTWPAERIQTLYNRIDIDALQASQLPAEQAREALGLSPGAWIVGNVGRLHPDKDQATLLRGFAAALPRLPAPSQLVIIGSGRLEPDLKTLAGSLGIAERVLFLGQVPQARRYFRAFDVFALSSDHEPFGMVLLEAMAAGVAVICTDCGGGREVVAGVGKLFPLGDAEALSSALIEQAGETAELPAIRARMEQSLRERFADEPVRQHFWSLPMVTAACAAATSPGQSGSAVASWADKARALDLYRWRLLRERHGSFASALRFARDALADLRFGWCARANVAKRIDVEPCDVLLLQSAPKVIALQRKKLLIKALRDRGHSLVETALPETRQVCREHLLAVPPQPVPLRYFGYAAHAQWLVERYAPKVLLNDRNGSLYAPFLRLALAATGRPLVHLAHASTVESSRRLGMNDYDYYLLFGRSSLEALQARVLRFGESTTVLAGSHMIDDSFDLPAADPALRTVLILGVGPDKEKEPGYQRTYGLLRDWSAANPQYRVLVKRHPRSQVPFWQQAAASLEQITVLPAECSLAQALEQASVVINIMSNAVIEAGLAARPVVHVNVSGERDIFSQERFIGPQVDSVAGLQQRLEEIDLDYAGHVSRAQSFAHFHLAHGSHGLHKTVEVLESLLQGSVLPDDVELRRLTGSR